MYEHFYGLKEKPFDLTPNPRYLLLTDTHREALSNLIYGIGARNGITVVTGEAGTGKTTLIRTAFARANDRNGPAAWLYLKNPRLNRTEFLEFLASRLGIGADIASSKTRLLDEIERQLNDGLRAALIVDEAQSVPTDLLEEIRLLVNIESDTQKLLPVVLVGQPELADRLNEPALRQLKQRVGLRCSLEPLSLRETAAYIAGRIQIAGGSPAQLFTRDAVEAVYDRSRGIARTISVICDNALLTGYAEELRPVDAGLVDTVCRDFDIRSGGSTQPAAEPMAIPLPAPPSSWNTFKSSPASTSSILHISDVANTPTTTEETDPERTVSRFGKRLLRWGLRRS
jgi:general secretion pathway protein A